MPSGGHNSIKSQEMMAEICRIVARTPAGLKKICRDNPHLPSHETIRVWLNDDPQFDMDFSRAKVKQTDAKFEEVDETIENVQKCMITDDKGRTRIDPAAVQLGKLKIDSIFKEIGMLNRRKYGNKIVADVKTEDENININIKLGSD